MSKFIKGLLIRDILNRLDGNGDVIIVDSSKMDANATNTWRSELRKSDIKALSVRNTLARKALEELGVTGLEGVLEGPSTICYGGEDVVALSKEITKWAKEIEKLEIKGGAADGSALDEAGVKVLSKSPSREELLSIISGQILAPGANLAAALNGPGGTLVGQIKSHAEGEGGEEAAES
ncbi:MAG: 50S ribosomal protein L10 [Planctomycetota bacterium]